IEAGLEAVADALMDAVVERKRLAGEHTVEGDGTVADVLGGARDRVAEGLADDAGHPAGARRVRQQDGGPASKKRRGADADTAATYKTYLDCSVRVGRVRPHQTLALRRGEQEKALSVGVSMDDERQLSWIRRRFNTARVRFNREQ